MSDLRLGDHPPGYRSGFASLVGRPNTGKSTLVNQLLRSKVAITSDRPQTTRNAIRGVLTTDRAQIVLVDTPGLHRPQTTLGERLNEVVRRTLREVDAVVLLLDASQEIGRGDAFAAARLAELDTPVVVALNKIDLCDAEHVLAQLGAASRLGGFDEIVPVSARTGEGTARLHEIVARLMPEGPLWYPPGVVSDQPELVLVAELLREKLVRSTREELPHSIAVVVEEMTARDGSEVVDVDAVVYVERESQRRIVSGRLLEQARAKAEREAASILGTTIDLAVRVKVERDWQKRLASIDRFGYGPPRG